MKLTNEQRRVVVNKIYNNSLQEIKPLQKKELADFIKKYKKKIDEIGKVKTIINKYYAFDLITLIV